MPPRGKVISLLVLVALLLGGLYTPSTAQSAWQSKVDANVLEAEDQGQADFIVFLEQQADLSGANHLSSKVEKSAYVYAKLTEVAQRTQKPVLAALQAAGAEYRSYWIANMIWVRGGTSVLQDLAKRNDIRHVYANPTVHLDEPTNPTPQEPGLNGPSAPQSIEWNIQKVNAPLAWAAGYSGQGVVIGGQDTGYEWTHPALQGKYRGWNGSVANHAYNWHDAIHSGGGEKCGANSPAPCDDSGHGTHTMGIMVGDDGKGNQIGMAPGARWIGCRNMDRGNGTPITYSECYQWFIAPTDQNNQNPDPSKAPDIVNNSWACTLSEGCTDPNVLLSVVNAVRAAGILTVHSSGNSGPACGSVNAPGGIYDASFTVGNTTNQDTIASSSSRGPVSTDGSQRMKPDISAPGTNIYSSVPGTFATMSGTSMAAPHVAGLAALLLSAHPELRGQVNQLEALIERTAVHLATTETCGGTQGQVPNNVFGWGRIDAWPAAQLALQKTSSASEVLAGAVLTYTLTVTNTHPFTPTTGVLITDTLPANTQLVRATQPYTLNGAVIKWDLNTLAANESRQVKLAVLVSPAARSSLSNEDYGAKSNQIPPIKGPPIVTGVIPFELQLENTAPPQVAPGGVLTYTLTVTNPNPSYPAHNLVLTDTLPAGVQYLSAAPPADKSGDRLTWQRTDLPAQQAWTVQFTVKVPETFTGTIQNNLYGVRSDEISPLTGPPVITEIQALKVSKIAPSIPLVPGDLLTYTLTVTNLHPLADIHQLVLTDTVPAGTELVSGQTTQSTNGNIMTWATPSLAPGESWSVQMVVRITNWANGMITNQEYGASSLEVPHEIKGIPVITPVNNYLRIMPLILRNTPLQ